MHSIPSTNQFQSDQKKERIEKEEIEKPQQSEFLQQGIEEGLFS